jgi:hypothetical protein
VQPASAVSDPALLAEPATQAAVTYWPVLGVLQVAMTVSAPASVFVPAAQAVTT